MEAKLTRVTQNSDKTVPSDRELYQAASPKTIGYTLVCISYCCHAMTLLERLRLTVLVLLQNKNFWKHV